jgi:hypothetical protein
MQVACVAGAEYDVHPTLHVRVTGDEVARRDVVRKTVYPGRVPQSSRRGAAAARIDPCRHDANLVRRP